MDKSVSPQKMLLICSYVFGQRFPVVLIKNIRSRLLTMESTSILGLFLNLPSRKMRCVSSGLER